MAEYIDREKVLEEINKLKLSTWFNKGKNEIADYQHCMYLERKEGVETVTDLCVKQQPIVDVVERSKVDKAIEEIVDYADDLFNKTSLNDMSYSRVKHCLDILKKHIGE